MRLSFLVAVASLTCVVNLVFCFVSDRLVLFTLCPFSIAETVTWKGSCCGRCIYACHVDMRVGRRGCGRQVLCAMSRSSIFTDQENTIHNHRSYPGTTVFITYDTHMSRSLLRSELAKNTHVSYTRLSPKMPIEQTANEGNKVTYGAYSLVYCEKGRP